MVGDYTLDETQRRMLKAATSQLEQAMRIGKNCQVVFNLANGGRTMKAKITLDIDLNDIEAG